MIPGRRSEDRALRAVILSLFALALFDCGLHVWTYVSLQTAVANAATSRKELYRRLDTADQNDNALADQLSLLGKELKLVQGQQDLNTKMIEALGGRPPKPKLPRCLPFGADGQICGQPD